MQACTGGRHSRRKVSTGRQPGDGNQVALPELPYGLEQLQQMQTAAAAIVASKEGLQQCSVVRHEFPMAKYTQYIELKDR